MSHEIKELCSRAAERADDASLSFQPPALRHEEGRLLETDLTGVCPAIRARAAFRIEQFVGGGFAGQVYRCRLESLAVEGGAAWPDLQPGRVYAVKAIVPPSSFARRFRNFIYGLAFQGPFSAQVSEDACRAGLIWQKLIRRAALGVFGRESAVKDVYASFYDARLGAWAEVSEWVEGRAWRLEPDPHLFRRRAWRRIDLSSTASAEYVAKRRFMDRLVRLLHEMGAPELARQYEWSTMKSQPNVLKRTEAGEGGPAEGLCAIDFRAGLALLPFLPMSPGDIRLILQGLFRRRSWVQFDRCDLARLEAYVAGQAALFADLAPAVDELRTRDRAYRRSLPDLTRQGFRLLFERPLRRDVRRGLVLGYRAAALADNAFADRLEKNPFLFCLFYLLGALVAPGRLLRRLLAHAAYRRHSIRLLKERGYAARALEARAARALPAWLRSGRAGPRQAAFLLRHPMLFLLAETVFGWIPFPVLHRLLTDPLFLPSRIGLCAGFIFLFVTRSSFRETWFLDRIADGVRDGMLTPEEGDLIAARVRDPLVVKYLKCLGAHFAMLPVTQLVGLAVGGMAAAWVMARGGSGAQATVAFAAVMAFFQVIPISPGSIGRGLFVVWLMIRERELHRYRVAVLLSFVKYIGYLAFPLQMTATFPELARFLAGRWAYGAAHLMPVFGERGALLEHWMFDLFFNLPLAFGRWARPRKKQLLTGWMVLGIALGALLLILTRWPPLSAGGLNTLLAVALLFVLPRLLFRDRER